MPRIQVDSPGVAETDVLELEVGEAVVIGRDPDPRGLPEGTATRRRAIPSPSVSANHVAAWASGEQVTVQDLKSRNGTWLRLPPETAISLPANVDVSLRLGWPGGAATTIRPFDAAHYQDASDYGAGVAQAVRQWLAQYDAPTKTWTSREPPAAGATSFRLATGEYLHLQFDRTIDERLHELLPQITRYVTSQNVLFTAEESTRDEGMILASPAIRQVHRRVVQAALEGLPRLVLLGPSGTGKERLAHTYHRMLNRPGTLVAINCATLSRDRLVADLFGAEAGAYTGAQRTMTGAVERADGGTLFLDEVGEIPLDVQPLLLRFLDSGEYQRLGAIGVARSANVFVVAATNRDLRRMVHEGTFRLDLYYRLALEVVEVPSLRERFSDAIAYLACQSLEQSSAHDALQPAALDALRQHPWVGNFRELVNVVRRFPRPSTPGSIDADTVRRVLASVGVGQSKPPPTRDDLAPAGDWLDWLRASASTYMRDAEGRAPTTWPELTVFVEQFLKPYALAHIAGLAGETTIDSIPVAKVAERIKADRGTVMKQLRRFFDLKS